MSALTALDSKGPPADPSTGVNITFNDLSYTIVKGERKIEILKGISGGCRSGRVLAIMGASGAGKTTLLDILAGQTFNGDVGGSILVNGVPCRRADFLRMSSYVLQRDVLLASSTVREMLVTSALLKLPRTMSTKDKLARVDAVIQELDLEGCQHTLIGDEALKMKGISGGQKRRVSVAMELVKDPKLLFLDEATSGLDSEMATSLMDTLVSMARKCRTIALTIHQPSSTITAKFDDFLMLAAGRLIYYGTWDGAVDYFAQHGYQCPTFQNPTDYFMSIVRDPKVIDVLADGCQKQACGRGMR